MTTVTPSDQAGSASSAKRPAAIPTQRSGRTLRILVLGTGREAAAFRERAASAGAELAQRFSVRVTHVVAEDGVGAQDARVARAQTAGLPVLALREGYRLLDDEAAAPRDLPAATPATADEEPPPPATAADATSGEAAEGNPGAHDDADEPLGAAPADHAGGPESWAGHEPAADPGSFAAAEAEPRARFGPEPTEARPSDLFTESALEAVLSFPPLRTKLEDDGHPLLDEAENRRRSTLVAAATTTSACTDTDAALDVEADAAADAADSTDAAEIHTQIHAAAGVDTDTEIDTDADADATDSYVTDSDAVAFVDENVSAGATSDTIMPRTDGLGNLDERGATSESAAASVCAAGRKTHAKRHPRKETVTSVAWALLPLVSVGLLTPIAIGYAARRLRSGMLYVETGCYTLAVGAAFTVSAAAPVRTGAHAAASGVLIACLGVSWLGGTTHSFLIRRRVFR
ncbi:hypothetical protein KGA66_15030 [Actinocrinis puniceicyclus]|uniref:BRCT domain-containing protein n=1 Tax=Actinocrinis puniceicyclus TaxID=977794 RepID=A0A8J8BDP1_9ACTN|nr:hypothetical protein [Actinocrinis puniceicyclus]MBS2964371.1 hypothetical protein [Actinocrinis puniceicyclus]